MCVIEGVLRYVCVYATVPRESVHAHGAHSHSSDADHQSRVRYFVPPLVFRCRVVWCYVACSVVCSVRCVLVCCVLVGVATSVKLSGQI